MSRATFLLPLLALIATPAVAEPTRVMVRAQSQDAKFIGTSMGGVRVIVRDARSRKILAQGLTAGGTGDTGRLVTQPRQRGDLRADAKSAGFDATLDLAAPTLVEVEGYGPVGKPGAAITVTSNLWVLPGRDLAGDGLILNFPGLVVEPDLLIDGAAPRLHAKVTLMCGCPIEAGGIWDAANYTVTARLLKGTREVARLPLAFTGTTSDYAAPLNGIPSGDYLLQVTAADAKTSNTGVAEKRIRIP